MSHPDGGSIGTIGGVCVCVCVCVLTLTPEDRKLPVWTLGAGDLVPWAAADSLAVGLPVQDKQQNETTHSASHAFTKATAGMVINSGQTRLII